MGWPQPLKVASGKIRSAMATQYLSLSTLDDTLLGKTMFFPFENLIEDFITLGEPCGFTFRAVHRPQFPTKPNAKYPPVTAYGPSASLRPFRPRRNLT